EENETNEVTNEVEDSTSEDSQQDDNIVNENEQVDDSDEENEDTEARQVLNKILTLMMKLLNIKCGEKQWIKK
ncbi:hypothetical protein A2U01_0019664, partial [Trifolium medium]|nr:hypothetical protein [Trifolium medium]